MDRDNTFAGGHKPFAVISDKLTRQGISVLRLDKRGAGKSSSNGKVHTTIELASDIYAAVALLSNQKEIDPKRIGLIGHSEGATIASMVISDAMEDTSKVKIAFGILLSGEGQPGISCLQDQFSNSLKASGISSEAAEEQMKAYNDMLEAIRQEQSQDIVNKLLREHILKQFSVQNEDELPSESRISFDSALRMSMYQMNDPWMQSYIRTDPQPQKS
jgi:alpha/beta superfamily hydrolase